MFENIIGYDGIKKEIELIISWYKNEKIINDENAKLPSGIIFYGPPGNGKTLFIKELYYQFKDNAFIIEGDSDNIVSEITSIYKKARENKLALVLIDEIDLLLSNDRIRRSLQDELDGINKGSERVLTIATTNSLRDLPIPLRRSGRFDRTIKISMPNKQEVKLILEHYFNKLNMKTNINDYDWLFDHLSDLSCADIVTLCNDCYLRYNGECIDEEKILISLSKIDSTTPLINENEPRRIEHAYHEIGHSLMVLKYKKYFNLLETRFFDDGAFCHYSFKDEDVFGMKGMIARIEIGLGGAVVDQIFYNDVFEGSESDLEDIRNRINYLVNRFPYKNITEVMRRYDKDYRMETEKTRLKNEKIGNKLLKKCYKNVYKYLWKHKNEIIKYANMLIEKGRLIISDFDEFLR